MQFPGKLARFVALGMFVVAWTAVAQAAPARFTTKPTVTKSGEGVTIRFALSAKTDVEVAILDSQGKVVRHLAAGVVGGSAAAVAPLQAGLTQTLVWDGLDDYGAAVPNRDRCTVRVRAGMQAKLQQIVGGDPYAIYSKEMGQGDHAAWRITGLEAKADGSVYLLGNANNYGPAVLRKYDAAGNFAHTVYPPPAGKPIEQVAGWGSIPMADGTYVFKYSELDSPGLSDTLIAGSRARIASLIPSPTPNELWLMSDHKVMRVQTDGTIAKAPMLDGELVKEPAMSPAQGSRPAWDLTGQMQRCLSADGKSLFIGGVYAAALSDRGQRTGAEPNSPWRDGQILKVDLATRKASVFFALDKQSLIADMAERGKSPIADARYGGYAALQGVATDAQGNVFVCDRQNERVIILDKDGKLLKEIPVPYPDAIVVSPKSSTIYVTSRKGHYHIKGEMSLAKFADWRKDRQPSQVIPLCEVHHYSQPTLMTIAEAGGQSYLWIAYTSLPVRIYQDGSAGLKLVKDFYEAGPQRALDMQQFSVDQTTDTVYLSDGFGSCFKISDWENPQFVRCMQDANTPLRALSLAIDSRNRYLYGHDDRQPVARYHLDGEHHSPAPLTSSPSSNLVTPTLTNDWKIGLGKGDRGIGASPDGSVATLTEIGRGPVYSGILRYYQSKPNKAPWDDLVFREFGDKTRSAGVRFDPRGNLYVAKSDGQLPSPLPGFERDQRISRAMARIYKYAPTGSLASGSLFPTAPTSPDKVYDVLFGAFSTTFTRTPRFGVDGFGRIYYPTSLIARVSVIDNQGNPILAFGTYGNRDSLGGLPGDLVPTRDIPLAWPNSVDATDDYIYVSDIVNVRLLRIAKEFDAVETAAMK